MSVEEKSQKHQVNIGVTPNPTPSISATVTRKGSLGMIWATLAVVLGLELGVIALIEPIPYYTKLIASLGISVVTVYYF